MAGSAGPLGDICGGFRIPREEGEGEERPNGRGGVPCIPLLAPILALFNADVELGRGRPLPRDDTGGGVGLALGATTGGGVAAEALGGGPPASTC